PTFPVGNYVNATLGNYVNENRLNMGNSMNVDSTRRAGGQPVINAGTGCALMSYGVAAGPGYPASPISNT
ncbi:hypothetical protein AAHS21_31745, partial [Mycobacterium sp. 050272]|uniref:hypothetical protein n=1 Tax=Mycobacterium sp. 050272 TaxID=3142488 RepID=UPI003184A5EE